MAECDTHRFFFDWSCHICKEEYYNLKGTNTIKSENYDNTAFEERSIKKGQKGYKEFNEERAKKLYEEIFLQYLKKGNLSEEESINRSKTIIRKQCKLRGIEPWSWA
jgi:hypothetical protein